MKLFYLTAHFFKGLGILILLLVLCHSFPLLWGIVSAFLGLFLVLTVLDAIFTFRISKPFSVLRSFSQQATLGDTFEIQIQLKNNTRHNWNFTILDEIPFQFQERNFEIKGKTQANQLQQLSYSLRPTICGIHQFNDVILYLHSKLGLVERRINFKLAQKIQVIPSIPQMKYDEMKAVRSNLIQEGGIRPRRLGHSFEFEQIKEYVTGDNYRDINWKASGKKASLMVNSFQEERSRQVYCILDTGRTMYTPFDDMTLLEHSVNAILSVSNIILKKGDKAGLITFSNDFPYIIPAAQHPTQLRKVISHLQQVTIHQTDSDFEKLYFSIKEKIKTRSLLLLFSNFDHFIEIERHLDVLKLLQLQHQLVLILFENTEVRAFSEEPISYSENSSLALCEKIISRRYLFDKEQIKKMLLPKGIHVIICKPNELSMAVINKYLSIKSKIL